MLIQICSITIHDRMILSFCSHSTLGYRIIVALGESDRMSLAFNWS
jgi:hypothetical protein